MTPSTETAVAHVLTRRASPPLPVFAFGATRPNKIIAAGLVGKTKLYQAMREGKLRFVKNGRSTIILEEDWNAFLASMQEGVL